MKKNTDIYDITYIEEKGRKGSRVDHHRQDVIMMWAEMVRCDSRVDHHHYHHHQQQQQQVIMM